MTMGLTMNMTMSMNEPILKAARGFSHCTQRVNGSLKVSVTSSTGPQEDFLDLNRVFERYVSDFGPDDYECIECAMNLEHWITAHPTMRPMGSLYPGNRLPMPPRKNRLEWKPYYDQVNALLRLSGADTEVFMQHRKVLRPHELYK